MIADGYDPTLRILHDRESDRGGYPVLALDRMEPMRPVVDRGIADRQRRMALSSGFSDSG